MAKLNNCKFTRVIVDEAAQSQEVESLISLRHAEQAVLIGDNLQLGPVYPFDVTTNTDSMLARLIEAEYPETVRLIE